MADFFDQENPRAFIRAVPDHDDDHVGEPSTIDADPYRVPVVDDLLGQAIDDIVAARTAPMSALAKINRDEILDLLEAARDQLPEELRRARWLLKEKEEFLAQSERERDAIIDQGRQQVVRMVERQEIVRAAEDNARAIIEKAKAESRMLIRQTEDFCDKKLATFELLLERTGETIAKGRSRLLGAAAADSDAIDLTDSETTHAEVSERL
jgi:vacuolar-type H+-ATPase subunit H